MKDTQAAQGTVPAMHEMKVASTNGGDGPNSYYRNSSYQRNGVTSVLAMIEEAIYSEDLDMMQNGSDQCTYKSGEPFRIADLGCSVGPNTFLVVEAIIEALKKLKYHSHGDDVQEFQAFFNDIASNDFNTLVQSPLWETTQQYYFKAVVPGSFHGRLFPKASLRFVCCIYALHWLSGSPKELMDHNSPAAWNKGRITCHGVTAQVSASFLAQFTMDMGNFLQARAEEVAPGGFMALLLPFQLPTSDPPQLFFVLVRLLDAALSDMVSVGRVEEPKVDLFNFPSYLPTAAELKMLIEKNGDFSIAKMEPLPPPKMGFDAPALCNLLRAVMEKAMSAYFGCEIMDEVFDRYLKKIEDSSDLILQSMEVSQDLFVLLKRKPTTD
ncbi:hypothetical protein H6P81_009011 [Aristolochia fimbriata]|uniref:S-adenosylmethionine-dependent methyltransferase n=1 Tax=Aristolochia fimbriata TaxID=158543 RepID=A0AAV7EKV8_ARIFI|nr:hypothetical protein H6P81_009011 [Aristolochia fimbriata]